MGKVTERYSNSKGRLLVICDFSAPRSGDTSPLEQARDLDADFICVNYNPGRSVRADSATVAYKVKETTRRDVIFTLATRDMNRLALQSRLLGAQMLGLENLILLKGDAFAGRDLKITRSVNDFTPTGLIKAVNLMNQGTDYKGLRLDTPTDFCIGTSINLSKGIQQQAKLTHRKVAAGAHFFITQPIYSVAIVDEFYSAYRSIAGSELAQPVFWGVQVLTKEGVVFSPIPGAIQSELEHGRSGVDIAIRLTDELAEKGTRAVYLVPPVLRGGVRDYESAQKVLSATKR